MNPAEDITMPDQSFLPRRALAAATLALAAGATTAAAAQPGVPAADSDAAMRAYEVNHWPQAYAAFAALADQGHAEAARVALLMRRHGPALYGQRFAADDRQVELWSRQAACAADNHASPCQLALRPTSTAPTPRQ